MASCSVLARGEPAHLWLIDVADPSQSRELEPEADGNIFGIGLSVDRRTITYIDGGNAIRAMPATGGPGQKVFDARHQVLVALLARFNKEGIEFAYPTTTNFTAAPDGAMVMPYPEVQPVKRVDLRKDE